jgi:DNA-directed RNA polymerase specialized sigma24 family protein
VADSELEDFRERARRLLRARGWRKQDAEDMLSEMTLDYLEAADPGRLSLSCVYLHARDRLEGRTKVDGVRQWDSKLTVQVGDWYAGSEPEGEVLEIDDARAVDRGSHRAMAMLRCEYGLSMEEIAMLFGVSESRISQLLGHGRAEVLSGFVNASESREFHDLEWEVQWLRF